MSQSAEVIGGASADGGTVTIYVMRVETKPGSIERVQVFAPATFAEFGQLEHATKDSTRLVPYPDPDSNTVRAPEGP